ncbi:hypothetical protein Lal_00013028 [Lupinus albus]|nr:hypothetical protein Lal_00013028 [Lupinus albus]
MKYTRPTYLKRIEQRNKKYSRDIKANDAYIIWDEPEEDTTSTSTSEDEESSKICLMDQNLNSIQESEQGESSEVNSSDSSSNSDNSPTYDILYGPYVEMYEELEKLAKKYMDKKMLILEHEKKNSELQSFIDELKLENETLDLIYANSSCNCTTKLSETPIYENCRVLNAENSVLKNKFAKFTYSSQNLDNLLVASRNVGNQYGLGYMHAKKSRMHGIPSGQYMWIQKGKVPLVTNKKGPNITWDFTLPVEPSSPRRANSRSGETTLAQASQPSLRQESFSIAHDFTLPGEPSSPKRANSRSGETTLAQASQPSPRRESFNIAQDFTLPSEPSSPKRANSRSSENPRTDTIIL